MAIVDIYNQSSEDLSVIDKEVHLVVTSPPYNVGKDYENYEDSIPLDEYEELLHSVFSECYDVLIEGGRVAVNVSQVVDRPLIDLPTLVIEVLTDEGFLLREHRIWYKGSSEATSAWGSWKSASNPYEIFNHEHILIFSKDNFSRSPDNESTMTKEQFMRNTKSVWEISPTNSPNHPATFPKELPKRLIQLHSFKGDTVLDPFMGVGTTGQAATEEKRNFIGLDLSEEYCNIAKREISEYGQDVLNW